MKTLANLRITSKLYLLIGLAMLVMVALAGVAHNRLNRVFDLANHASAITIPSFNTMNAVRLAYQRLRVQTVYHVLNDDPARLVAIETEITEQRKTIDTMLAHYTEKLLSDERDKELAGNVSAAMKDYLGGVDLALMLSRKGNKEEAQKVLEQQAPKVAKLRDDFTAIVEYNEQLAKASSAEAKAASDRAEVETVGMVALAFVCLGGFGWLIARRELADPITEVVGNLKELAAGSMSVDIVGTGRRDEIGDIARAAQVFKEYVLKLDIQTWIKTHVSDISSELQKAEDFRGLTQTVISKIAPVMGAGHGAFYVLESDGRYHLLAGYGYRERKHLNNSFAVGEGLVGQCIMEKSAIMLTAPQDYIRINSGLGEGPPACIIVQPIIQGGRVLGVLELASFQKFNERELAVLQALQPVLASGMEILDRNLKTKELLAASQEQAERMEKQAAQLEEQTVEMEAQQFEIKAAEDRMRVINDRFELVNQAASEGLWDMTVVAGDPVNMNNQFWWAPRFRTMLGFTDENDFPNVLGSWANRLHPDDKERTLTAFAAHLNDRSGKTPYDIEYQLQRKDGSYGWYRARGATLRDNEGVPLRVAGSLADITASKLAEMETIAINERFELVNQAASEGLWDMTVVAGDPVNMNNQFWWAPKFRTMLGFTDENDFPSVLGSWANRLHPNDKERTLTAFAAHLNDHSGKTPYDIEYQLQRKDGSYGWYRARGATLRNNEGVPLRVAGSLADISAIKAQLAKIDVG
jgi:PAS domain S-box-containing protein